GGLLSGGRELRSGAVRRRAAVEQSEYDFAACDLPARDWRGASIRALHPQGARRRFRRAIRGRFGAAALPPGCPRFVNRRNRIDGANRRAAAEGNRARNSGVVVRGALGSAIRPGDDPRARGLPLAAASPATGALVVTGKKMDITGRRSPE